MHNKISFLNIFCVLFLIGKIGHLGTLGGLPWAIVFLPLVLDLILDFLLKLGYVDRGIIRLRLWLKIQKIKNISKRTNKQT